MTIQIMKLDEGTEPIFWEHVNKNPPEYLWFIMDWKYEKESTEILMALDGERVEGMMVIFKKSIVQIRGNRAAVRVLLEHLDLREVEIMAPLDCQDLVLKRYTPRIKNRMVLMCVERDENRIERSHELVKLAGEHADQISNIMRESLPDWWENWTPDKVKESMKKRCWLGVVLDGKVVSLGSAGFDEPVSIIGVVATDEHHRNRGYATSVVSGLVEEILSRHERALIHVLEDNHPAIRTYQKVGFKPFRTYLLIKNAKRIGTV